jgi:hypothetical protein
MRFKSLAVIATIFAVSGCALIGTGGPPNPEGEWTMNIQVNGEPRSGTYTIEKTESGAYSGTLRMPNLPFMTITGLVWQEDGWLLSVDAPHAPMEIKMLIEGSNASGNWTWGPNLGDHTGERITTP